MAEFEDLDDIQLTLEGMNDRYKPLVQHIPRGPGQREDRYTHLLCGSVEVTAVVSTGKKETDSSVRTGANNALEARIEALEQRLSRLEQALGVDNDTENASDEETSESGS